MSAGTLAVIGAGGHAKVVIATARSAGFDVVALYDDNTSLHGSRLLGVPVRGAIADIDPAVSGVFVLAIGDNATRYKLADRLSSLSWATIVHQQAIVHESVRLSPGSVVFAGVVIQPDSEIGAHVIVNTGVTIDHDCHIGDFVHLAPGTRLAGGCRVGEGAFIGIGSCVIPGKSIGDWSMIGAGAAVTSDIGDRVVAFGVPAKVQRVL